MEIEFELVNNKEIAVIGIDMDRTKETLIRKRIGTIFTPAGSGRSVKNAIQVCGINEAFDLWGCSEYQTYKYNAQGWGYARKERKSYNFPIEILDAFDDQTQDRLIMLLRKANENLNMERNNPKNDDRIRMQLKDIQLRFPYPSESLSTESRMDFDKICMRCFNDPCTCESKISGQSPYSLKDSRMLHLEVEEKEGEGKILSNKI